MAGRPGRLRKPRLWPADAFVDCDDPYAAPGARGGRRALPPWTLRRGLQNLFWIYATGLVFMIFSVADLLSGEFDPVHTAIGSVQLALIGFGYLFAAWVSDASIRVRWAYVIGFAALLGSTAIVWGWGFANNGVYLAILLATLIPWRRSRVAIPVLGAILTIISAISGDLTPVYIAVIGVGVGLATAAGIESGRVSYRLAEAEQRVSVLALAAERERIGRDLHDILGHSLTAISIKSGLAAKLVDHDPAAAKEQLTEIADVARQALADVRSTASGFRQIRVTSEIASARSVLLAADIDAQLPTAVEPMPDEVSELFGYVVREAVTNVVRHSEAASCTITVDAHQVTVTDDGRGFAASRLRTGLRGLEERVAAAGGALNVSSAPGRGTTITAVVAAPAGEAARAMEIARS